MNLDMPDPDRMAITAKQAARELNVDPELLHGLVRGRNLDGYYSTGRSGHQITMVYVDQIEKLRERLAGQ